MNPRIAIVYLSYNTRPYIDAVISSLENLRYPKDRIEFVIVDNHSPDGSAEVIRQRVLPKSGASLPHVTFFGNPTNEGFSDGCNIGIRYALNKEFDYIYLLNNDAKFHPDALNEAVKLAEADRTIGSVQSLMLLWQQPEIVNSTGGMIHFLGFGFVRDNGRRIEDITVQDGEEINYASGAAVLYRASVLRQVGLLDPFYFMYHEDLELGWRIRLAGFKNVLARNSIVYHHYEFKRSIAKFFWMERNRILVHFSHLHVRTLLLLLPWMLLLEVALILFAIKGGWLKNKLSVYAAFFHPSVWRHLREKRRASRSLRRVPDREIVRLWTARIEHQGTHNPVVEKFGNPLLAFVWSMLKFCIRW